MAHNNNPPPPRDYHIILPQLDDPHAALAHGYGTGSPVLQARIPLPSAESASSLAGADKNTVGVSAALIAERSRIGAVNACAKICEGYPHMAGFKL